MNQRSGKGHRKAPAEGVRRDADAEADHFARAMADVVPVKRDRQERVPVPVRVSPLRAGDPPAPSKADSGDNADEDNGFAANGVDRRELRKLKRGDHPPGDRLDLHRMTVTEAVATVTRFVERSRSRHRCVSIVHGRGLHSEGNVAVLKARVRELLRQSPAVLAYADAPVSDGGAGAVYVLLRK